MIFSEYKEKILSSLNIIKESCDIKEEIGLIDGFINPPLLDNLTDSLVCGGKRVPMIMVCGVNSGRVYLFSLKIVLSIE